MDINQFVRHPYKKKRIENIILDTVYETRRRSTVYLTHVNLPVQMKNVQLPPAAKKHAVQRVNDTVFRITYKNILESSIS